MQKPSQAVKWKEKSMKFNDFSFINKNTHKPDADQGDNQQKAEVLHFR